MRYKDRVQLSKKDQDTEETGTIDFGFFNNKSTPVPTNWASPITRFLERKYVPLTVKELIEHLQKFDPETQVIMQKDSDGKEFSPLSTQTPVAPGAYFSKNFYSGKVLCGADAADYPPEKWEMFMNDKKLKCVVLFPT